MIPSDTNAFASLSTITFQKPHVLHPDACNPVMDLVVLLCPETLPPENGKGKGRMDMGKTTTVELWRMSGSQVWQVDVQGIIAGLQWSPDGLHLSLLVLEVNGTGVPLHTSTGSKEDSARLDHLSVHTGSIVRSVPVPQLLENCSDVDWADFISEDRWWRLDWTLHEEDWPKPMKGSGLMLVDQLPRVTPVEPPKPAHAMLFLHMKNKQNDASSSASRHSNLADFPSLLPAKPPVPADILRIRPPRTRKSSKFLSGTFSIKEAIGATSVASANHGDVIRLSLVADKISDLLDTVLKGIEAAEHAFREGQKQTIIWREEVETCAHQQGMSNADVHADIFRLLISGRSGPAVSEWLGNRLTGRTVAKWEETMASSYKTVQKVLSQSICPALERIVLLLGDLEGQAKASRDHSRSISIRRCINIAMGFATLAEHIRREVKFEAEAGIEFVRWLNYEITKSSIHDQSQDAMPNAAHDIKLVWAFLKSGFVASPLTEHFPNLFVNPPKDLLDPSIFTPAPAPLRPLDDVLRDTTDRLNGTEGPKHSPGPDAVSPSIRADESAESAGWYKPETPEDTSNVMQEIPSSPDTVDHDHETPKVAEGQADRHMELEPWVWANTLVKSCAEMIRDGSVSPSQDQLWDVAALDSGGETLFVHRKVDETVWVAFSARRSQVILGFCLEDGTSRFGRYDLQSDTADRFEVLSLQFFDDAELAIHVRSSSADGHISQWVMTMRYDQMEDQLQSVDPVQGDLFTMNDVDGHLTVTHPYPVARCKHLDGRPSGDPKDTLALNGRKGRRVGCVLISNGKKLEVLDMEEQEDGPDTSQDMDDEA